VPRALRSLTVLVRSPSVGGRSRVAVVIVTRDRCRTLLQSLDHIASLDEGHRLVLVDNASTDDTRSEVAKRHPSATILALERNLGAAARTVGVEAVSEPYVAFCDDDSWWAAGSLARAERLLDENPGLALIAGRVLVGEEEREDPTCQLMSRSPLPRRPDRPGTPVLGFLACAAVVRRSAYLQVGGFHPAFGIGGEETLLALDLADAGWDLSYLPEVVAHHHPPPRPDNTIRRRLQARNALWCAWLRRPLRGAVRHTVTLIRMAASDRAIAGGVTDAVAGLTWVFRERRPVAVELENSLRLLGDVV
jgi:GT2 family glycosyltransferase